MKSRGMDSRAMMPKTIRTTLGGIMPASVPTVAMHPAASLRSMLFLSISGRATRPNTAVVDVVEPEHAANPVAAKVVARTRLPRKCPTHARAAPNMSSVTLDAMAMWPISRNSGTALNE